MSEGEQRRLVAPPVVGGGKHPSFYNRTTPSFQLMSQLASFKGQPASKPFVPTMTSVPLSINPPQNPYYPQPVGQQQNPYYPLSVDQQQQQNPYSPQSVGQQQQQQNPYYSQSVGQQQNPYYYQSVGQQQLGGTTTNALPETVIQPTVSRKKPVTTLTFESAQVTGLFNPPEPVTLDDDEQYEIQQKFAEEAKTRQQHQKSLIGGISSNDPWKTTMQSHNDGEGYLKKGPANKKFLMGRSKVHPNQMVSPITGELVADYGSWRTEASDKLAYDKAAASSGSKDKAGSAVEEKDDSPLGKLRTQLFARGASGIFGLARRFKIMDDDGSNSLSMGEFKKAIRDCGLNLTDYELTGLFNLFDADCSGALSFDEFLIVLKGPMNTRRKKLVNMAFDVLDKDGSGTIDMDDMVVAYNVTKHPDFLSKKSTKEQILRELLDNFDVGGVKDGIVTREDFANYYSTISASIDSDDYFELMLRNAWHISGGEGACENSSNLRVLVTFSDGRQEVVEVKNDLGLDPKDGKAVMARLKAQGVNAVSIGVSSAAGDKQPAAGKPAGKLPARPATAGATVRTNAATVRGGPQATGGTASSVRAAAVAVATTRPKSIGELASGTATTIVVNSGEGEEDVPPDHPYLDQLREQMRKRGATGLVGLQRAFRNMDDDGSNSLSLAEFKKAMKECKVILTDMECTTLFRLFDKDNSGTISYDEFITGIRGKLNPYRKQLVDMAFAILDKKGRGFVEPQDILGIYSAKKHPDVISGRKTEEQVLREFLDTFDVGGEVDGKVTRREFENYYSNISASIDDDVYFELVIRNAWHITGGVGQAANSSNRRVLVTRADGTQSIEEIKNDLGLTNDDRSGIAARLKAQGVDASDFALYGGMDTRTKQNSGGSVPSIVERLRSKAAEATRTQKSSSSPPRVRPATAGPSSSSSSGGQRLLAQISSEAALKIAVEGPSAKAIEAGPVKKPLPAVHIAIGGVRKKDRPAPPQQDADNASRPDPGLKFLINRMVDQIKSRGDLGFTGLQRVFQSMDGDDDQTLSMGEFKKALKEMNILITENEVRLVFNYFDSDHSGCIDFTEFLDGIRLPLNERRLAIVNRAFTELDPLGGGVVDFEKIGMKFNAEKHPEVLAGRMTPKQALAMFLDSFQAGGEVEDKCTRNEFVNYYTNVGAAIESDDYFDVLIRSCWRLGNTTATQAVRQTLLQPQPVAVQGGGAGGYAGGGNQFAAGGLGASARNNYISDRQQLVAGHELEDMDNGITSEADLKEEAKSLQSQAVVKFSQRNYKKAIDLFASALELLQSLHGPAHPECEKVNKSIEACTRKLTS